MATDYIAHPLHGIGALTPGQKLHLKFVLHRQARISLTDPVAAKYLRDIADDDMPPPAAPALPVPLPRAA